LAAAADGGNIANADFLYVVPDEAEPNGIQATTG